MAGQTGPSGGATQLTMPPRLEPEFQQDSGSGPLYADEGPKMESARSNQGPGAEDRRLERQKFGLIKYGMENGVPDVGGLGWRSKQGHVLKNQSYYSAFPNTNIWNNPAHAGPRTWKSFHGPRLRTDANLMESLDRLDEEQLRFEVKKMYINTTRVQTLDRFYNQKTQNEQKEIHHTWAPHRRAKREYCDANDRFEVELDSMPLKELKKVLTPCVLHGDREAIRNITQRIQREETWKATWKDMETARRQDILSDLEERMTYNHMLMDLAGQPTRRRDPNRTLPNSCTERLEELAKPKVEAHLADVTQLTDYRGLVHVDHQLALEARFPGKGHEMSSELRKRAAASAVPGWPPPERPETPNMSAGGKKREASAPSRLSLTKRSLPASAHTLSKAVVRHAEEDLMLQAAHSINCAHKGNQAPPAPDQSKTVMLDRIVNNHDVMSDMMSRSQENSVQVSNASTDKAHKAYPPPVRPLTYPILVDSSPKTDGVSERRAEKAAAAARLGESLSQSDANDAAFSARATTAPRMPPLPMKDVKIARFGINIIGATGLRGADRNGLSDPYVAIRIPKRPKMKYQTRTINKNLNPTWRESFEIEEFYAGDELEIGVYDRDVYGHECLGKMSLTQDVLLPDGIEGAFELYDEKRPEDGPVLRIKIMVLENYDPDGRLQAKAVRGAEDSDEEPPSATELCSEIDNFEASLRPVPRLGNFWMTPRGDMRATCHDGGAVRKTT